jgi:hypothetical protein
MLHKIERLVLIVIYYSKLEAYQCFIHNLEVVGVINVENHLLIEMNTSTDVCYNVTMIYAQLVITDDFINYFKYL